MAEKEWKYLKYKFQPIWAQGSEKKSYLGHN